MTIMFMVAGCNRDSNKVIIHYESEYGTVKEDKTEKSGYTLREEDLTAPVLDEEIEFTFAGWFYEIEGQEVQAEIDDEINEKITLTAKWTPKAVNPNDPNNPNQDPNNPNKDPANPNNPENKNQDPNNNPSQDPNNNPSQNPVKAKYKITYTTQYGTAPASKEVEDGYKLTEAELPALTQAGYVFGGWDKAVGFEVKAATSITATWTPATNTPYKVEHYQQNAADGKYVLKDTENLTGTTNTNTNAVAKVYSGFKTQTFEQAKIAADGSTVIKINYNALSNVKITLTYT